MAVVALTEALTVVCVLLDAVGVAGLLDEINFSSFSSFCNLSSIALCLSSISF